jgi:hypothetical protein
VQQQEEELSIIVGAKLPTLIKGHFTHEPKAVTMKL